MKQVISSEKIPIKIWATDVEESALQQAKNLANLPFAFKHVALMPDTHSGYGCPIGGVLASDKVVVPFCVGSDISCGMIAVKTNITDIDVDTIKKIMGIVRKKIPVGFEHQDNSNTHDKSLMPEINDFDKELIPIVNQNWWDATFQIGTLGGGNHFWELQRGSDGFIWFMIHSGSRNLGFKVAKHYDQIAQDLNQRWFSSVKKEYQLAFLPIETREAKMYMEEMNYCIEFALANRLSMAERTKEAIYYIYGQKDKSFGVEFDDPININHNYAQWENHFGKNVLVHRKGATLARKDTIGIIPGSQGSSSYIVRGKGNPESFMSCSHGAGRKMSRKKAREELNLEKEKALLDEQGIVHSIRNVSDLDEATGSYKNIDEVMANQTDLVEILIELKPLGVIKG